MILIKPITITEPKLTSTIPVIDTSAGEAAWVAGTYSLGQRAVDNNAIYEVVADPTTTDRPSAGVAKTPKSWVYISSTNRFRMFDNANNTQSIQDNLTVQIVPSDLANSLACFNVDCTDITVTVFAAGGEEVYSRDVMMRSRPQVNSWYNYYYSGFDIINKLVLLDLPPTTNGSIKAEFFGNDSAVGTFVIGNQVELGAAQYGTGAQLLDFSNPVEDEFGNITYTDGFRAKLVDFKILADTTSLDYVFTEMSNLGQTPAVFVGNPCNIGDSTLVYGQVRDYNQTYTWGTKSKIQLTVRGLV